MLPYFDMIIKIVDIQKIGRDTIFVWNQNCDSKISLYLIHYFCKSCHPLRYRHAGQNWYFVIFWGIRKCKQNAVIFKCGMINRTGGGNKKWRHSVTDETLIFVVIYIFLKIYKYEHPVFWLRWYKSLPNICHKCWRVDEQESYGHS